MLIFNIVTTISRGAVLYGLWNLRGGVLDPGVIVVVGMSGVGKNASI